MGKDLIMYDNSLNRTTGLNKLSTVEQDIVFCAFSKISNSDSASIYISYDDLFKLTEFRSKSNEFRDALHRVSVSMLRMQYSMREEDGTISEIGNVFEKFRFDEKSNMFVIIVTPSGLQIFRKLKKNYSQFLRSQFVGIRQRLAKALYRLLIERLHRSRGEWTISVSDIRAFLEISEEKEWHNFTSRLPKYIEEIRSSGYFAEITMTPNFIRKRGRPIESYTIRYVKSEQYMAKIAEQERLIDIDYTEHVNDVFEPGEDGQARVHREITGVTYKAAKTCPQCHRPIITRRQKDGTLIHCCEKGRYDGGGESACHATYEVITEQQYSAEKARVDTVQSDDLKKVQVKPHTPVSKEEQDISQQDFAPFPSGYTSDGADRFFCNEERTFTQEEVNNLINAIINKRHISDSTHLNTVVSDCTNVASNDDVLPPSTSECSIATKIKRVGRVSKSAVVVAWRKQHPEGSITECVSDTGLSRPTVLKWWGAEV